MLRGTWDLPGPGLEPVSPAWAGGFLTTAPPGKPRLMAFRLELSGTEGKGEREKKSRIGLKGFKTLPGSEKK